MIFSILTLVECIYIVKGMFCIVKKEITFGLIDCINTSAGNRGNFAARQDRQTINRLKSIIW